MTTPTTTPRTATPQSPPEAPAGRGPTRWERWRTPVLCGALVVLIALLTVLLTPRTSRNPLAPDSVARDGARAVATVLADQGVTVASVTTFDGADRALVGTDGDATLLVTAPDLVSDERWRTLLDSGADLVLLAPGEDALAAVAPGVSTNGSAPTEVLEPGCTVPAAEAAGAVRAGGRQYAVATGTDGTSCYAGTYLVLDRGEQTVTVLGQGDVLTNQWAAADGNGALSLRTLGAHETLVWYRPDPLDTDSATVPLQSLVPPWALPSFVLLLLAGGVAALWRGRRLGRLVPEPLPVVVRAVETVEGHGRLYATAGAAGRAAEALRAATLRRLRAQVRLEPTAGVDDVATQVAWVTGRRAGEVRSLLADDDPADDTALVRLAGDLEALERDVRHLST